MCSSDLGPPQGLVRGRGHEMGMAEGARMQSCGNEPGDVCDVGHEIGPHVVGYFPELLKVDELGIGAGAGDDELRFFLAGYAEYLVLIEHLVLF